MHVFVSVHKPLTDPLCSLQVDLSGNGIGVEGGKAIAGAISVSNSLTAADLRYNYMGSEAEQMLRDCVKDHALPVFELK